jgi:hypothetical protein
MPSGKLSGIASSTSAKTKTAEPSRINARRNLRFRHREQPGVQHEILAAPTSSEYNENDCDM